MRNKELGFAALVSIVIGGQLGSGIFVFPSLIAPFGAIGIFGWLVSACGAMSLAFIFAELSSNMPKNGGPHVYVAEAFGKTAGFFTAWIYWILSWSGNAILLITTIYYLVVLTGELTLFQTIAIEVAVLSVIVCLNTMGVRVSGIAEIFLTILKVCPLLILPAIFLTFFEPSNFDFSARPSGDGAFLSIGKAALITCWGFVGIECATVPASSVYNPKKTIPKALMIGTLIVAFVFIVNSISVLGITGFEKLIGSSPAYSVAAEKALGHLSTIIVAILAITVCIGTLNAWMLVSGQIARGAADDGLFPPIFGKLNKMRIPTYSILFATVGLVPFFIIEQMYGINRLDSLIGLIVSIFLFVYLACCAAYLKTLGHWRKTTSAKISGYVIASFAIAFSLFVVSHSVTSSIIALLAFITTGIPVYAYMKNKRTTAL